MKKLFAFLPLLLGQNIALAQDSVWSLNDCIEYAVTNNLTVKRAEFNRSAAQLDYDQSKYNRLPSVSSNISTNFANGSSIDPITSTFESNQILSNSYGINSSLTLYQGNKLNLNVQKSKLLVSEYELYVQEAQNNITLSIIEAYLQALYYHEGIVIAETTAASTKEELDQAQLKFDNGSLARLDLTDMETQYADNLYQIVSAQNNYDQQILTLKQLLELSPTDSLVINTGNLGENITALLPDKQSLYEGAAENLPNLKILELQLQSAQKDLQIAKAGYLPTVTLNASVGTGYTNTLDFTYYRQITGNTNQNLSLGVNIPIFSKYQNRTNVRLAELDIKQAELNKTEEEKSIYAKIETAWMQARANIRAEESAKLTRDNAKLTYDMASKKYKFGSLTNTELMVSRNTYLNAEQNYLQKKYLAILYQQLLNFYQGNEIINL